MQVATIITRFTTANSTYVLTDDGNGYRLQSWRGTFAGLDTWLTDSQAEQVNRTLAVGKPVEIIEGRTLIFGTTPVLMWERTIK